MTQSTPNTIDLDSYFHRIGLDRSNPKIAQEPSPTLETLQAIHLHHAQTIAFENLNSLLKQPVPLDLPSLQQKLIHQQRGGYCFEQNALLRSVLEAIGFPVTSLAARVLWNVPEGMITPRSHMLLQVEIDGVPYIADVGFGGLTLTTPLWLEPNIEQATSHEPFRLIAEGQTYLLQAFLAHQWKPLYRFDLQPQQLPDYEVSNWYVSTHPNSLFVNFLIAARPDSDCRYALRNNHFTTHYLDGHTEKKILSTPQELHSVLEEVFQLQLPDAANLDSILQKLVDQV